MNTNTRKLKWQELNALKDALKQIAGLELLLTKAIERGEISTSVIVGWHNQTEDEANLIKSNNEVYISESTPLFLRRAAADISNVIKSN